jgi:hypothetical protein
MTTPDAPTCISCGKAHVDAAGRVSCTAHSRTDPSRPCLGSPVAGHHVCRMHGGASPGAVATATSNLAQRALERRIGALLKEAEHEVKDQHPIDGLLEVVRNTGGMVRVLRMLVGEDEEVWGPKGQFDDAAPTVHVELYRHWNALHLQATKLALEAGIDERMVRNAEATGTRLFDALDKALSTANLTPSQSSSIRATLAAELRALG